MWELIAARMACLLCGLTLGLFGVVWETLLQERVPDSLLGRVINLDQLVSFGLNPIGYVIVGVLSDHLGPSLVFVATGLSTLLLALGALGTPSMRFVCPIRARWSDKRRAWGTTNERLHQPQTETFQTL